MSGVFDVKTVNRNGRAIVFMSGEIDLAAKEQIGDALSAARQGSADVVVDLSELTFIDSTGINALVSEVLKVREGRFQIVGVPARIRRVFEITGVADLLLDGSVGLAWEPVTHHGCDGASGRPERATTTPLRAQRSSGPSKRRPSLSDPESTNEYWRNLSSIFSKAPAPPLTEISASSWPACGWRRE